MGKIAIRKVNYYGDKYHFSSPYLGDGIVIMEGLNGHGKSTFMNLIYYGLGGKVVEFNKHDKASNRKHNEICQDSNNYIELEVEINNQEYTLTRYIGENIIFILEEETVIESNIFRGNNSNSIFSDWILSKLNIEVFDMIQGTNNFKINFADLMRLIYHDQTTEVDKIYKEADNSNFLSDSLEIRKAIFEVLMGNSFNDYYAALGEYKLKAKEYDKERAIMESYDQFLSEILSEELSNTLYIDLQIEKKRNSVTKLRNQRNFLFKERSNSDDILRRIDTQKRELMQLELSREELLDVKENVARSIDKVLYLIDGVSKETKELEKIRFVNNDLKLFSPNTCPYCLREVIRKKGKCVCGSSIDEEEYEKFFYSDEDYLKIIRVKYKSIESLTKLLAIKKQNIKEIEQNISVAESDIKNKRGLIRELTKDIETGYNSASIREIDSMERDTLEKLSKLKQAKELAEKRENIEGSVSDLRQEVLNLKIKVERYLNDANQDMQEKKKDFSSVYSTLMKAADAQCYSAYIGEDYMPNVNFNSYRERSASVPKRLMYFLTLLIESLKHNLSFPKFLMIDTPNKEGIDKEKLITNINLLGKISDYVETDMDTYQIILTTGLDTYPQEYSTFVFQRMGEEDFLLQENVSQK